MKIYTPVKDFNGLRNNVRFINGVGETNDPKLIEWFRTNGYKVALENPTVKIGDVEYHSLSDENLQLRHEGFNDVIEKKDDEIEPDFEAMTAIELRDYMRANGYSSKIKNTRNKEKLLEILRG